MWTSSGASVLSTSPQLCRQRGVREFAPHQDSEKSIKEEKEESSKAPKDRPLGLKGCQESWDRSEAKTPN